LSNTIFRIRKYVISDAATMLLAMKVHISESFRVLTTRERFAQFILLNDR